MDSKGGNSDEGKYFTFVYDFKLNKFFTDGAQNKLSSKQSNILPLWGNERTMNLNPLILTNIQSSHYFKGKFNYENIFIANFLILQ